MTLSTIYNPYSVIGANTIDANKVGESLAFGGNSGLFAQLLQPRASSRSLMQVRTKNSI